MSWSLGETRALAIKAARGIGMPWGMAEEAGYAIQWLHANDLPGVAALQGLLAHHQREGLEKNWTSNAHENLGNPNYIHCPIALGIVISDAALERSDSTLQVRYPLLLLPFLGFSREKAIQISLNGSDLWINNDGLATGGSTAETLKSPNLSGPASCSWQPDTRQVKTRRPDAQQPSEIEQSPKPWARVSSKFSVDMKMLDSFAAKTYAPATDASRLLGAGAGLNDND